MLSPLFTERRKGEGRWTWRRENEAILEERVSGGVRVNSAYVPYL